MVAAHKTAPYRRSSVTAMGELKDQALYDQIRGLVGKWPLDCPASESTEDRKELAAMLGEVMMKIDTLQRMIADDS